MASEPNAANPAGAGDAPAAPAPAAPAPAQVAPMDMGQVMGAMVQTMQSLAVMNERLTQLLEQRPADGAGRGVPNSAAAEYEAEKLAAPGLDIHDLAHPFKPIASSRVDASGAHKFASELPYVEEKSVMNLLNAGQADDAKRLARERGNCVYARGYATKVREFVEKVRAVGPGYVLTADDLDFLVQTSNSLHYFADYFEEYAAVLEAVATKDRNAELFKAMLVLSSRPGSGSTSLDRRLGHLQHRVAAALESVVAKRTAAAFSSGGSSSSGSSNAVAAVRRVQNKHKAALTEGPGPAAGGGRGGGRGSGRADRS